MDIEKFLNENKDNILRFELHFNHLVIHIKDKGRVEFDTESPFIRLNAEHITNE
jgi:hypothetical protein